MPKKTMNKILVRKKKIKKENKKIEKSKEKHKEIEITKILERKIYQDRKKKATLQKADKKKKVKIQRQPQLLLLLLENP